MSKSKLNIAVTGRLEERPLKSPFVIAGYEFRSLPLLVVEVERGGYVGRGEAAGVYYLGDTPAHALADLERATPGIGADITRQTLRDLMPPGGARNALDCALWDLEAAETGRSAANLAGIAEPQPLVTTLTLGIDTPEAMAAGARAFAGARALKLKLSGDAEIDCARVRAVRTACPAAWIAVDANQGYRRETLPALIPTLVEQSIALLEQPFARGREPDMADLNLPIPTAADESCLSLAEIESLPGRFDIVNIKLDKCGGLTEGLMIAARARELGLGVMVGNMMGTSLAVAPAFLLGQICDVADLDAAIFLAKDRDPPVEYHCGTVTVPASTWGSGCQ
jgi:L-alanine-DL-glutamate epimerase-like enolase superfamily enzyme